MSTKRLNQGFLLNRLIVSYRMSTKRLNQGFLLNRLIVSFRMFVGRYQHLVESVLSVAYR